LRPRTSRAAASVLAAVLAAALLAACGDEEDAQTLTFTVTEQGKGSKIVGPQSAETGLAEITLQNNNGKREADLQLLRVEGDHSAEEVVEGLEKAMKGQAFPEWFFGGGGVGITGPSGRSTVTQVLEPGTYYAIDTEGQSPPDPKSLAAVEVSGETSDEEIEADSTVSAFEYGFKADGLSSGKTEIAFENSGAQPHHLLISEITGNKTVDDVEQSFKSEKGPPPLNEKNSQSTAVIEGGETQLVTLDLKPGRYAMYCFISDREGGPPHALKGMVDEVEVE
jgi:copper binding plastocyanin/azurin family protein